MKRRYQIWCALRVSGIIFITYAQSQNILMSNNLKVLGSDNKTKGPKREAKIGYGHYCDVFINAKNVTRRLSH